MVTHMVMPGLSLKLNLRIWRDERMGQLWRVAYPDGDGETIVGFPDTAALGDFIAERLGLDLVDAFSDQEAECA